MLNESPRWWQFAVEQCARLSAPDDVEAADRELEGLLRSSAIGSTVRSALASLGRAWDHSRSRALVHWITTR